jgi:hypothetical protein
MGCMGWVGVARAVPCRFQRMPHGVENAWGVFRRAVRLTVTEVLPSGFWGVVCTRRLAQVSYWGTVRKPGWWNRYTQGT